MKDPLARAITIAFLIITGCAYDTDEIYFKEIPPLDNEISFILDNYDDADTIVLKGPETLTYEVTITPGEIEKVELILNDVVLLTTKGGKISFPFPNHLLNNGVYNLTIQFSARKGLGSLAENRGGERIHSSRKWVLIIEV